jgi:hypothetical protein
VATSEVIYDNRDPVFVDSCQLMVSSFMELNIKVEIWHSWTGVTDPLKVKGQKKIG